MRTWLRRLVERRPLLWTAALSAAAVLAADGPWGPGLLPALVLAVALAWSGQRRLLVGGLVVAGLAGGMHWRDVERREDLRAVIGEGRDATLKVRVVEEPRVAGLGWSAVVEDVTCGDRFSLRAEGRPAERGEVLRVEGRAGPVAAPRNPGQFDTRRWLDREGVVARLEARRVGRVSPPPAWWRWGGGVRAAFRESVTRGLDPASREAAVIRAVVLGERPEDETLVEPFRLTGTLHLFAVSGLHVGMVGLLGWGAMRLLGVPRRAALVPLMALMFGYAWLTGLKPPAVRAAWMAAIVLGAFWFRRRPEMANALGLAGLWVLLLDGDLLFTAGVQLSFGVVLAIGLLHPWTGKLWRWITREEAYLPRVLWGRGREIWSGARQRTADMLTVSTSAWLGSAPLTAWHFGIVTPMSVPASVVLSLLVFPLLALALLSALCSPVPGASEVMNRANARLAGLVLGTAETGAEVPGGHVFVPRGRPAEDFVVVYDLRDEGAAMWHLDGHTGLIDAGGTWGFEYRVMPSLRRMALEPRSVAVTHPDGGHAGGLPQAFAFYPVERGMLPVVEALSPNFRDCLDAAESHRVPLVLGRCERAYPISESAHLEVLHEPEAWNLHLLADERVMPVRLHWDDWRILFMGDAGWGTERDMRRSGIDLSADVVVAGRHGHDASLGLGFLEATGARAVIATHADYPPEEQLPEAWRAACETRGIEVFHQGESGAVTLTRDGGELVLRGWVDGRELRLEGER